jgi:hypothetical protein
MKVADANYGRLQFLKALKPEQLIKKLNLVEGSSEIVQFVALPNGWSGVWIMMDAPSKKVKIKKLEKVEKALPTQTEEIK